MAKTPQIETCFAKIEAIIEALAAGELGLDDALKRYADGLKSIRQARELLDGYAARIEELRADADGEAEADR